MSKFNQFGQYHFFYYELLFYFLAYEAYEFNY